MEGNWRVLIAGVLFRAPFWIPAAPPLCQFQEIAHNPPRVLRCTIHLDMELGGVDITSVKAQTLRPGLRSLPSRSHKVPSPWRPLDLTAVALHNCKLGR